MLERLNERIKKFLEARRQKESESGAGVLEAVVKDACWYMGFNDKKPGMRIDCECHLVNISKGRELGPASAVLKRSETRGTIEVEKIDGDVWAPFSMPDKYMARLEMHFSVPKPFAKAGQGFRSDILIHDRYLGTTVIKDVYFRYR